MKIRKIKSNEVPQAAKILKEEATKFPYNKKYILSSLTKRLKNRLEDDFYVAIEDEKVVGFVIAYTVNSDKKLVYIDELWINSDYQGRGIGKKFMNILEEKYKKKGVKKLRLVSEKKSKAYNFYKKLKYKDHDDLVFMEKKIWNT